VLEAESRLWSDLLAWDYRSSTDLLLQYLDARVLPGFVAVEEGRVIGYAFCVYEERKAVIGDVFAVEPRDPDTTALGVETLLLEHLIELLQHSPGVERIESQLLLHAHDQHGGLFRRTGFAVHRRIFMELDLGNWPVAPATPRGIEMERDPVLGELEWRNLELRAWRDTDFSHAGTVIAEAYEGHLDSIINDQYRSVAGSLRFLHNIIRFPGCGLFDAGSSRVLADRATGELAGVLLCSRVRGDVGHITQVCVAKRLRGLGVGRLMLESAIADLAARGFRKLSLTVTEANANAVALYRRIGFTEKHAFDAMVWTA
jgi:ribosomal protein S18 acetylase RimI-like enzyme